MSRVDGTLRKLVEAIRCWDPEAKIILFGSRARGDYIRESDYDLIIVSSRFAGVPFIRRAAILAKEVFKRDVKGRFEFLCYTPEEFERKRRELGIVSSAVVEGIEL